jgi:hypothetical protein
MCELANKRKKSPYLRAYVGFAKRWRKETSPLVAEILAGVKRGDAPAHVVKQAFARRKIADKFEEMVMDSVVESVKIAGVKIK